MLAAGHRRTVVSVLAGYCDRTLQDRNQHNTVSRFAEGQRMTIPDGTEPGYYWVKSRGKWYPAEIAYVDMGHHGFGWWIYCAGVSSGIVERGCEELGPKIEPPEKNEMVKQRQSLEGSTSRGKPPISASVARVARLACTIIRLYEVCCRCDGTGRNPENRDCVKCNGEGTVAMPVTLGELGKTLQMIALGASEQAWDAIDQTAAKESGKEEKTGDA